MLVAAATAIDPAAEKWRETAVSSGNVVRGHAQAEIVGSCEKNDVSEQQSSTKKEHRYRSVVERVSGNGADEDVAELLHIVLADGKVDTSRETYHHVNHSRQSVELGRFVTQLFEPQAHPSGEVVAAGELHESW